jgi:hypothetical protein
MFLNKLVTVSSFLLNLNNQYCYCDNEIEVQIFHLIDNMLWGELDGSGLQGQFNCPSMGEKSVTYLKCAMHSNDKKKDLLVNIHEKYEKFMNSSQKNNKKIITVSLYNIHTWIMLSPAPHLPSCALNTDLAMVESEESTKRFKYLFSKSFPWYDGNSTTSPFASIQRSYINGLNLSSFLPLKSFTQAIKGAAYVASTCHKGGSSRDNIVTQLQKLFRIDSLGKCKKNNNKNSIVLNSSESPLEHSLLKQKAISHYLFYLAFENTREAGYITEKVMDALIAGVVPVYLGDTEGCKYLYFYLYTYI